MIAAGIAAAGATAFVTIPALAQDVIKVGAPLPLTGPLAPEGLKQKRGYDLWAEAATAKGGIKAGGKTYKIEIVYTDYASNTPRAVQAAERMITEDKVNFLFAPFGSGATKAASAISRSTPCRCFAPTASSAEIFDQGYKYIFATLTGNASVSAPIASSCMRRTWTSNASPFSHATICFRWRSRRSSRRRSRREGMEVSSVGTLRQCRWIILPQSPRCAARGPTGSTPRLHQRL
jgi:ABC-type branched-subunit amino acid transport system substrate-binding protein